MEVQNWTKQEKQRDRSPSFVDVLSHGFLLEEVTLTSLAGAPAGLQPMLQLILSGQQCGWVRTPALGCHCVPIVSSKKAWDLNASTDAAIPRLRFYARSDDERP